MKMKYEMIQFHSGAYQQIFMLYSFLMWWLCHRKHSEMPLAPQLPNVSRGLPNFALTPRI